MEYWEKYNERKPPILFRSTPETKRKVGELVEKLDIKRKDLLEVLINDLSTKIEDK